MQTIKAEVQGESPRSDSEELCTSSRPLICAPAVFFLARRPLRDAAVEASNVRASSSKNPLRRLSPRAVELFYFGLRFGLSLLLLG